MFCIWLDDVRPTPSGFYGVRSVNEAKVAIMRAEAMNMTVYLDLDHDLGDYAKDGGDGIELIKWLIETERFYPISLHTMNPVGRDNMRALIERYWR